MAHSRISLPRDHPPSLIERLQDGFTPQRIVPRRHVGRIVAAIVVVVLALDLVHTAWTSPGFGWPMVGEYLFNDRILHGVVTTIWLTAATMAIGIAVGILMAVMVESSTPLLKAAATFYIWAMRSVPTLVQLLLWFNLALLFPTVEVGIPFTDVVFWSGDPNTFMTPVLVALLGLGLSEGAYMAEIVRSGLNSVDRGQQEAAYALGMRPATTFRRVVFPQALRTIVPPTGNQVIGMLKYTSLASVVSVSELLFSAQTIYAVNFQTIPLLLVATLWYAAMACVLQVVQGRIEARLGRGVAGRGRPKGTSRREGTKKS